MRFVHYNIYNSTIIFYYHRLLYLYNIIIICDIDYPFILGFSWECHCNLPRLEAHSLARLHDTSLASWEGRERRPVRSVSRVLLDGG